MAELLNLFRTPVAPRHIGVVFLCSLTAAGLVVLVMAFVGEYTKTLGRFLLTALSLTGFSLLALAPVLLRRRSGDRWLGGKGLGSIGLWAPVLGFGLVVGGIWGTPNSDAYWKGTSIVSIWAGSISYLCWLVMLSAGVNPARILRQFAAGAAGGVPLLATVGILAEVGSASYWWAVVLLIMVQLAGGAFVPALTRWGSRLGRLVPRSPTR